MEIKLLVERFDLNQIYQDFLKDEIDMNSDYVSEESVTIDQLPDFPIYLALGNDRFEKFKEAVTVLRKSYIKLDRDIHLNSRFWYSVFCFYKRSYIIQNYPEVLNTQRNFENIVFKKFDWENYVYKCILVAEYGQDKNLTEQEWEHYLKSVYNNFDMFNYLIKYSIFRNGPFIVNFLSIIEDEGLSKIMKKKIKNRPDLGNDERYGRRVVFELNKNYPVIMAPLLDTQELRQEIERALRKYGAMEA